MKHQLHLTSEELAQLALAVYLGDWMANGNSTASEESHPDIYPLLQKIYKLARDDSATGLKIRFEDGVYACAQHESEDPTGVYEQVIAPYDQSIVFEELASALAARDTHEKLYHTAAGDIPPEDIDSQLELTGALFDDYLKEFEQYGFNRVVIDKSLGGPCKDSHDDQ